MLPAGWGATTSKEHFRYDLDITHAGLHWVTLKRRSEVDFDIYAAVEGVDAKVIFESAPSN